MPISSAIDLNLGQVPQIDDPILYEAILDIHNALEKLAQSGAAPEFDFNSYIARQHNVVAIGASGSIPSDAKLILASGAAGTITLVLPTAASVQGYEIIIKCVNADNPVIIVGDGAETIDNNATGIELNVYDSIIVKSDGTKWWIV